MWSLPALPAASELAKTYSTSQYCLAGYRAQHGWDQLSPRYRLYCREDLEFDGNIDDPSLYTLAGWEYLRGEDPSAINPELQPLTKYLFGLAQLVTGTPLSLQLVLALGIMALSYRLARLVLSPLWSLLPPLLLLSDPLFRAQLTSPYLDLSLTFFTLWFLSLLARPASRSNPHLLGVVLGLASLAKSFSHGAVLVFVYLLWHLFSRQLKSTSVLRLLLPAALTYLAGYAVFFWYHPPLDFLRLHLFTLKLYHAYVPEYPRGEIFRIIFTGQWREWYGQLALIPAPGWSLLWPIATLTALFTALVPRVRRQQVLVLHLIWISLYLLFLSLRLPFPRYLLPILPSLYLVLTHTLYSLTARR